MRTTIYSAKPDGIHCNMLDSGRTNAGIDLHEDGCEQANVSLHFDSAADALAAANMLADLVAEMLAVESGEAV